MSEATQRKIHIAGWLLFVVSPALFIAASIRAGDALGILGGVFFLAACIVFLVPFVAPKRPERPD